MDPTLCMIRIKNKLKKKNQTNQLCFSDVPANNGTEVTKIRGTSLADRDKVVGAESGEPRHKHLLRDLTAQQGRHLAHQLQNILYS